MRLINIPDISPPDDGFTNLDVGRSQEWVRLSGLPRNVFEKQIRGVRLSRYRGAIEAAQAARDSDIVISHLPLMTNAVSIALSAMRKRPIHLAFAFNFTNLPSGRWRNEIFTKSFRRVDRFVVFSKFERTLYSETFQIPPDLFTYLPWSQLCPPVSNHAPMRLPARYFCAVGGEGRDITLIMEAARRFEGRLDFCVITRPNMIKDVHVPSNVITMFDVPLATTWRIAKNSLGLLVPLVRSDTCCGHITIVSAKMLGIPIITTDSVATHDYISNRSSILTGPSGDVGQFVMNLERAMDEEVTLRQLAEEAAPKERVLHAPTNWENFLKTFIASGGRA